MKSLIITGMATVMASCAAVSEIQWMPTKPPSTKGVVAVSTRLSVGHVCPVSDTTALTAEHISSLHMPGMYATALRLYLFGEVNGVPITLKELKADKRRDLSIVQIQENGVSFAKWHKVSQEIPVKGDSVWLVGYDYAKGLGEKVVKARVIGRSGGSLYYAPSAGPGSSGSCVLDLHGDVVAINTHSFREPESDTVVAGGQIVAGRWGWDETRPQFLE